MKKRLTTKEKNKELALENKVLKHYGLVLRVYPTEDQKGLIHRTIGCTRFVFNHYLSNRQTYYKEHGKSLSVNTFKKEGLNPMKKAEDYSFLKEVDKFALEVACESVQDAYERFFKGQNRYPQFKSKRKAKKSYTTKFTNNNISIIGTNCVKLPKLGHVKMAKLKTVRNKKIVDHILSGETRILTATITQKGTKYYVALCLEEVVPLVAMIPLSEIDTSKIIGVDLGLKTFAVIDNGQGFEKVERENYIKASEKKLAKLQRRLSKKSLDSQNYKKANKKVSALQERIANQRKDFAHKLSNQLTNENQVVILETLNIKGMVKNKRLAKSISDAGWSQFQRFTKYKCLRKGKHFVQIDKWYACQKHVLPVRTRRLH